MAGYHIASIPRGQIGHFSKINEEFMEFLDAVEQKSHVMALVELSDLMGSIRCYYRASSKEEDYVDLIELIQKSPQDQEIDVARLTETFEYLQKIMKNNDWSGLELLVLEIHQYLKKFNLGLKDLLIMSEITERVFVTGYRTSRSE